MRAIFAGIIAHESVMHVDYQQKLSKLHVLVYGRCLVADFSMLKAVISCSYSVRRPVLLILRPGLNAWNATGMKFTSCCQLAMFDQR